MIEISKQLVCQKYIYKIHSSRLRKEKWKLNLSIEDARRNDEVISLADSQVLRWIDEINGITDADAQAREIRREIRRIKKQPNSSANSKVVKRLYKELDTLQFQKDYMCLIIDKNKDYHRACSGFYINGLKYVRLLGTNGGIKNSTIVFVSERVADEIRKRIENGRDQTKPLVTAKLEAYKALACSASNPVSFPKGIAIVEDSQTQFYAPVNYLTDIGDGEPLLEYHENEPITLDATDGCGIMLPSLAERWSEELGLNYMMSGCNTRFSFSKGMVFTFDFVDFAEKIAESYYIQDAWGDWIDVRDVELILTTSMVKLWDSYESCDDYIEKSLGNHYTFGITKTCPKELESMHTTNYQFIQCLDLDDDEIEELIRPTMEEIKSVLGLDWRKTILFFKGIGLKEENIDDIPDDYIKAMMINPKVVDDPFVRAQVYRQIKNRINEAKVGVLNVHGNYSILSGDPYLLCQSVFGLKKTGLLKAGQIYNKYWTDLDCDTVACFRAPMTTQENIVKMHPTHNNEIDYWYQYMTTCTILNGWDTTCAALNGCDFDGDLVMITDNKVIVDNVKDLPALMCAQRKASKRVSSEADFIQSNIDSFGNDIGRTTNWATSMYEVAAGYDKDSVEYKTLEYRIQCAQLYQQNAIDKAKGIICKPMPADWHDLHAVAKIEDEVKRGFYKSIVADKKPYFMRYIYPSLMREYNTYIKNTNKKAKRNFRMTLDELLTIKECDLTDEQKEFLLYYNKFMPVGENSCVMNRICRRFEEEFDGYVGKANAKIDFDYSIYKSDKPYTNRTYYALKELYDEFNVMLQEYAEQTNISRFDKTSDSNLCKFRATWFKMETDMVCPNDEVACNALVDLCYNKSATKRFVWGMCSETIIKNLLFNNNNALQYPTLDDNGDIEFGGYKFSMITKTIGGEEIDNIE